MFFKGVLLEGPDEVLENPGSNLRISRQVSFTDVQEIVEMESILKSYIKEAIEVERAGLEVNLEEKKDPFPRSLSRS